jgi:hypothetical protein
LHQWEKISSIPWPEPSLQDAPIMTLLQCSIACLWQVEIYNMLKQYLSNETHQVR